MDSQHRHELAENDLAKTLTRWGEKLELYANQILIGVIVIAVIAAGVIFWTRSTSAVQSAGWADLTSRQNAAEFGTIAESYPDTAIGAWASLQQGRGFLDEGVRLSLTDRSAAMDRLEQAEEAFLAVLDNDAAAPETREQALVGLAVTRETRSDGDTTPAVDTYKQLIKEFPDTRFLVFAQRRIQELTSPQAQQFYAWYHKQSPKPEDRPLPQDNPVIGGDSPVIPDDESAEGASAAPGGQGDDATNFEFEFDPPADPFENPAEEANPFAPSLGREAAPEGEGDAPADAPMGDEEPSGPQLGNEPPPSPESPEEGTSDAEADGAAGQEGGDAADEQSPSP